MSGRQSAAVAEALKLLARAEVRGTPLSVTEAARRAGCSRSQLFNVVSKIKLAKVR